MEQSTALLIPGLSVLSILTVGVMNFFQLRIIDRLRNELKTEREKNLGSMQDAVNALQLVLKYQNYLKDKGIPFP